MIFNLNFFFIRTLHICFLVTFLIYGSQSYAANSADHVPERFNDSNRLDTPIGTADQDPPLEAIQSFVTAFDLVKSNYVNDIDDDQLFEYAKYGLLSQLDPYSHYLDQARYQQVLNFTDDQLAQPDFKVSFDSKLQQWQVSDLVNEGYSYQRGLRNGMVVDRINGVSVEDLDLRSIESLLVGNQGSVMNLKVQSNQRVRLFEVIRNQTVSYQVQSRQFDGILVIRIQAFQQGTAEQVKSILDTLSVQSPIKGILLDIRDNPGGLLSVAVNLADLFLEQGLIVTTKGKLFPAQQFRASPNNSPIYFPLAVLQNRFSASAAEVLSAALKEQKRAIIVGETSYGKGAIQRLFPLDKGALQLTVAYYYTPDGHLIEGKGVIPTHLLSISKDPENTLNQAITLFNQYVNPAQVTR